VTYLALANLPRPPCTSLVSSFDWIHGILSIIGLITFLILFVYLLINIILNLKNKRKVLNRRNIILFILLIVILNK